MKSWNSGRVQDKLINKLDRQEKQKAFQQDRFIRYKTHEIHNKLSQELLLEKIIETDNPAAISDALLKCLKKALKATEFDFKYYIAPIRNLTPHPNPYALYITQFIMEDLLDNPNIIEIYGTDLEIYDIVNNIFRSINNKFAQSEKEIMDEIAKDQSLFPGSRDYEIALDQLTRKKLGEPKKI